MPGFVQLFYHSIAWKAGKKVKAFLGHLKIHTNACLNGFWRLTTRPVRAKWPNEETISYKSILWTPGPGKHLKKIDRQDEGKRCCCPLIDAKQVTWSVDYLKCETITDKSKRATALYKTIRFRQQWWRLIIPNWQRDDEHEQPINNTENSAISTSASSLVGSSATQLLRVSIFDCKSIRLSRIIPVQQKTAIVWDFVESC